MPETPRVTVKIDYDTLFVDIDDTVHVDDRREVLARILDTSDAHAEFISQPATGTTAALAEYMLQEALQSLVNRGILVRLGDTWRLMCTTS